MAALIADREGVEVLGGWGENKSRILSGKRDFNYDVFNCGSLGQANYESWERAGSCDPPVFADISDAAASRRIATATPRFAQVQSAGAESSVRNELGQIWGRLTHRF